MSKNRNTKIWQTLVLVLSFCLAVLIMIAILLQINEDKNTFVPTINSTSATIAKNQDSIAIPGYEMLELKANSKAQSLCLLNPEQNMCYFQISLYLEDGTLLWQSRLIEPGKISKPMVLSKALSEGTYPNAVLRYACYRLDEYLTPLNGAETKLTLWVK